MDEKCVVEALKNVSNVFMKETAVCGNCPTQ